MGCGSYKVAACTPTNSHVCSRGSEQLCKRLGVESGSKLIFSRYTLATNRAFTCDKCKKTDQVGDHWHCAKKSCEYCLACVSKLVGARDLVVTIGVRDCHLDLHWCDRDGKSGWHWQGPDHNKDASQNSIPAERQELLCFCNTGNA
mmetsp:Transcript_39258/g.62167  ORF Transcript_39258/g.62167 Transcript_39258/m.62167 type:complete len:146 (+) Transcript_39258:49-486(+)